MNEDEDSCVGVMLVGSLQAIYTFVACCKAYYY